MKEKEVETEATRCEGRMWSFSGRRESWGKREERGGDMLRVGVAGMRSGEIVLYWTQMSIAERDHRALPCWASHNRGKPRRERREEGGRE